jgi:RNA polymerase sigma-32 factor
MLRYITVNRRSVVAPETRVMRKLRLHLNPTEVRMQQQAGRTVSDAEIADELGVTAADVVMARTAFASTDVTIAHGEPSPHEHVPKTECSPEEIVAQREERLNTMSAACKALQHLTPRELTIIRGRVMADRPRSLRELGGELGLSRERVRQLQLRALAKMRVSLDKARRASVRRRKPEPVLSREP